MKSILTFSKWTKKMSKIDLSKMSLLTKNFVLIKKNYGVKLNENKKNCYDNFFKKNLKIFSQKKYMETLGDLATSKTSQNEPLKFYCNICDYTCCKRFNFNRHKTSSKHILLTEGDKIPSKTSQNEPNDEKYICLNCSKEYSSRNGLWKHKSKCNKSKEINIIDEPSDKQLIMMLIKENSELRKEQTDIKEMILEIVKNGTHITSNSGNTTHTNSHNKAFNLNFFLNETCKNAMNITDFVDSIKLQLSDLIDVGELGYVEGISKIIVKNLNNLDENVRPIHCTDKKRETMYVKDKGEWEKEDEKKSKITKAVKRVADKNIRLLPQFREKYPEYKNSSSKTSDKYDKMVLEVMTTDEDKNEKIVKNISKVTTIK